MDAGSDGRGAPMIHVFLVDDHGLVRRGMRAYLELAGDIEVVGEAARGEEALLAVPQLTAAGRRPDVVLTDLVMPGLDGIALIRALRHRYPYLSVVALTGFAEPERVRAALQAGAGGYLLKDADPDQLAAAVRAAYRGEVHLDPAVAKQLSLSLRSPKAHTVATLTRREQAVLALVAEGLSNRDIAHSLSISERTARIHVSNMLIKLGLPSRTQAALWAVREGVLGGPPPVPG
ncbi:MAG TPA: response regulator transcription factor [Actinomycetota bacterium]|nr:response regulator transcription factor [Actinomycetota bacterium]